MNSCRVEWAKCVSQRSLRLPPEYLHHEFGLYPLKLVQGQLQSLPILI